MINIVWSTFNAISIKNPRPPKSVIIFYTKFDSFSIFQPTSKICFWFYSKLISVSLDAGAQSTAFGLVTLLGLAWVVGRVNPSELLLSNKDIVFLFINGENWNSYGSFELTKLILKKQFPYSIKTNLHPIEPEHIDIIINIDQLGLNNGKTYILYDNIHPFLQKLE
jgi:hypothetical protein